ncbi:hypothetical protein BH20ACT5_BH20ACT5_18560 [soil metagenome]
MITAVHTLIYADDAVAARAFFRDVLGWPHVDADDGWLIFRTGPSELAVHPATEGDWSATQQHEITLMCDDIEATVADLEGKGVRFGGAVSDTGFGLTVMMPVPGVGELMLYQPLHPTAHDL